MNTFKVLSVLDSPKERELSTTNLPATASWKRILDLTILFLGSPLFILMFAFVCLWSLLCGQRRPLLFQQTRIGHQKRPFELLKFRTMVDSEFLHSSHLEELVILNEPMRKIDEDHPEVFLPGARLIRAAGLDELPQLLNIWRGEMSFVGPRPCLPQEIPFYDGECQSRFDVLPGLTGKWQVCGKNELNFQQMLVCDRHYVNKFSLQRDLALIARTPGCLIRQINQHLLLLRIARKNRRKVLARWHSKKAA